MDDARKTQPTAKAASLRVLPNVQDPISAGLKALWAAMEDEPVPDDFLALLDRIDKANPIDSMDPEAGPAA